ncbi:MAG: imidazole glycerol phosphate synthase subunit HisH [Candidatus Binatia bacterium]
MIAIVDYGMGNLRSVEKAIARTGATVRVTSDPRQILEARGVVLPGVGAFGACMENLSSRGLVEPVHAAVASGKPFLGICLGLQLLFEESEEFGPIRGLGILPGRVVRFGGSALDGLKIPQMGWNRLKIRHRVGELGGIDDGAYVYFVHSYYVVPSEPDVVAATTDYGVEFTAAIAWRNVFACQFHPEKSQTVGLRLLANFAARVNGS